MGCQDDKLNILAQGNKSALVAIKTSKGITERTSIPNVIMQGTVNSGLLCTCTTDKLAKMVYSDNSLIYKYKGVADVPPLEMVDDILTISKCSITSIAMNATVNAFLENKKLKLSQGKCCVIHVGKVKEKCHELKAHGEKMHQVESAKYLGDIIHKSGKVTTNLAERRVKAAASSSIIRAILQDIPLGKYRTEIGLELRQAMFINSVLYNSETWHGLKPTDITELELIDKQLLRFICKAHAKTPVEFLYLETGALPISFIISSRRLNYLHTILNRNSCELLNRVYCAQRDNPSPGDFVELIKKDFDTIEETFSEPHIKQMSKDQYKLYVKKKIHSAALKHLKQIQEKHAKVRDIEYSKLSRQLYLSSSKFSNSECEILFALRSNTLRGFKANSASNHRNNMTCPLKCNKTSQDDQEHMLFCQSIFAQLKDTEAKAAQEIYYKDIYGSLENQKRAVEIFTRLLDVRSRLLQQETLTTPTSGTTLDTATLASQGGGGD